MLSGMFKKSIRSINIISNGQQWLTAVENLHIKYALTAKEILAQRDGDAEKLNQLLMELGYE